MSSFVRLTSLPRESTLLTASLELADADNLPSIQSLLEGLSQKSPKGTYIQLSGAASVFDATPGIGQPSTRIWDDINDLHEISNFDATTFHALSDQLVLSEGKKHGVQTAIVEPPFVYGTGEGPIKKGSIGLPLWTEAARKRGKAFLLGQGKHIVSGVHVKDLSAAFLLLVERALEGGGKADWGENGIYYVESGSFIFREVAEELVKEMIANGAVASPDVEHLSLEEGSQVHPYAGILWGTNLRVAASRLQRLGWKPKEVDVFGTLSELAR